MNVCCSYQRWFGKEEIDTQNENLEWDYWDYIFSLIINYKKKCLRYESDNDRTR